MDLKKRLKCLDIEEANNKAVVVTESKKSKDCLWAYYCIMINHLMLTLSLESLRNNLGWTSG